MVPGSLCTGSVHCNCPFFVTVVAVIEAGQLVPLNRTVGKCNADNAFPDIFAFNMTDSSTFDIRLSSKWFRGWLVALFLCSVMD